MIDGLPWQGLVIVATGGWTLAFGFVWLIFTGRAASGREIREKNGRIEFLQTALANRDEQVRLLLHESVPVTSTVLQALHAAVEAEDPKP